MTTPSASRTARGVALLRAAHRIIDDPPPLLDDTVIGKLLGADVEQRVRARVDDLQSPTVRGLRSHVLLRSRFAEDSLAGATDDGIRQYVVLGAGLDTFAYRQPDWAHALSIVEVDQPASQADKRAALASAGIVVPQNVRYANVDFERETLAAGLERCGVAMDEPTFFSWLGVTMYLTREAIEAVLRTVVRFPKTSAIVLTFSQPRAEDDHARAELAESSAALGEPWVTYFTPVEIGALLRDVGFSSVAFLERDDATRRYYADRRDGLVAPRRVSIVTATA
jgi:methyltransferase (TIGR00027 family)